MTDHCAVQTICLGLNEAFAVAWRRCHVKISVWLVVRWFVVLLRSYSVLQRPTTYYSSTTPTCYSVLQRTTPGLQSITPVLLCTTKYYSLLQSTTPVLLCTTKYYSSTTLYYKVLLQYYKVLRQYYSVLQSTTPVLLCTTKYYSSETLYYKVLRQYYSVLQSTTAVKHCTTKYYASTTLYYKVLLQWNTVLQSTTPVLLCTTKYYASTTLYYASTTTYYSGTTLKRHLQMRGATRVSVQLHQILRLPRKMNVINDLRHIWNVISNAWSKSSHPPTSPNTAPATQNECHQWSASHMKPHFQCVEQLKSPSNLTKYCACHEILKLKISSETPWSASANRKTIRGYPTIIRR